MKSLLLASCLFLIVGNVQADCWFGCDTIHRDKSTDLAKLRDAFGASNMKKKEGGTEYFCIKGEKNKNLTTVYLRNKDDYDNLIIVTAKAYSPPDIGESSLNRGEVSELFKVSAMKTLNFGVAGILEKMSGDKRCAAAVSSIGSTEVGFSIVCDYSANANLPIKYSTIKHHSDFHFGYKFCK